MGSLSQASRTKDPLNVFGTCLKQAWIAGKNLSAITVRPQLLVPPTASRILVGGEDLRLLGWDHLGEGHGTLSTMTCSDCGESASA